MTQLQLFGLQQPKIPANIARRDRGIRRAMSHANQVAKDWNEHAVALIVQYAEQTEQPFMGEDVRAWAFGKIAEPPHVNAWGGAFIKAARAGLIVKVGYNQTANKQAHARVSAMWRRKDGSE